MNAKAILAIKTDNPIAEVYLLDSKTNAVLSQKSWQAHRMLGTTLHEQIKDLFESINLDWQDIVGVIVFAGPGSFTGLRIGFSVANAVAASLSKPIVAAKTADWLSLGATQLKSTKAFRAVEPYYGAEPNITTPKK